MLRKLLKHDLKAIFRLWWIVALASLILSVVGATSMNYLISISSESAESNAAEVILTLSSMLGVIASIVGISAFTVASEIFVYVRFYQNFYSDEGYLTFTLPVKRRDLLNSKLLSALIVNAATFFVVITEVIIFVTVCAGEYIFTENFIQGLRMAFESVVSSLGTYLIVYAIEATVILTGFALASYLLIFGCISFAATIVKKHKALVAVGIVYGVSSVVSFAWQIFSMFGSSTFISLLMVMSADAIPMFFAVALLAIAFLTVAIVALLYTIEHFLLDRKLNLS